MIKALLTALFLIFISLPAFAQTPISKEAANNYFNQCVGGQSHGQLSPNAQNMLCACTAARMTQFLNVEDMQAMASQDTTIARPAFNKMMIDVYAPCMEMPTQEYHYNACISDPKTASYGDPQKICECMSWEVANYMKSNGQQVFRDILARNHMVTDPMAALTEDPSFQQFAQSKLLSCLK